jgi:DNA repair protein SbcC/Rad50
MILNTLQLAHYKQYASLTLDFREGLVGVIGKNGAGKSTIFEAILYCLFGRDESNKALVRSSFADPKANVELQLDFSIGDVGYRVRREFRGKAMAVGAELFKNDLMVAKGVSAVNDELVKVLHMERDAFKRSVFSGQKELSELSDSTGEARKRMVRRMLGLDTLDDVQTRVNTDIRDLSSQVAGQRQNLLPDEAVAALREEMAERDKTLADNQLALDTAAQRLQDLEEKHRTERQKFEEEQQRYTRHNALQRDLAQAQERLAGQTEQRAVLQKKIGDLQAQQVSLGAARSEFAGFETEQENFNLLDAQRQRQLNRDTYASQIQTLQSPIRQSRDKLAAFDSALLEQENVEIALREKQAAIENLNQQREAKVLEMKAVEAQISALQERVSSRRAQIAQLEAIGRDGECPTCFQPVRDAYDAVLRQLDREISDIQTTEKAALERHLADIIETGKALRSQRDEAEKVAQTCRTELARLGELARQRSAEADALKKLDTEEARLQVILREIGEAPFDEAAYQSLKAKRREQEPRYREFLAKENYVERELPAALAALASAKASIAEASGKIAALSADLAATNHDATRYEAAKQAVTTFNETLTAQSEQVRALEKTKFEWQAEQSKAAEKLRAHERILAQISDKLEEADLLRKLAEMLSLFKTEILEKVSPGISREASELFSRITKGKYEGIRVDENFDFAIADGGQHYPIERFSGGEVDLANFCLRIAITKAIMELSGTAQRLEFLAFDEIFGSQDEERRLEMMLALNYLQEQFRQIYIVSHIDSLKDYFPHLLEVQSAEEGSVAVWR